jgi:hypothetical protein
MIFSSFPCFSKTLAHGFEVHNWSGQMARFRMLFAPMRAVLAAVFHAARGNDQNAGELEEFGVTEEEPTRWT